jgi:hypothetical protein
MKESAFSKWIWIVVLIIVGIVAAFFAIEYLTHSISQLPSWIPGSKHGKLNYLGKPVRGHEYKRGYVAVFVAVVAFAWAGWLIYKNQVAGKAADAGSSASVPSVPGPAES